LVVLSWMAEDPGLREAFLSGQDVHRYTAAQIFGKDVSEVEPQERRVAKPINFGIMYGMSAFRLSNELEISRTVAASFIQTYFERYSGVRSFVEKTNASASEKGYVTTYWGHMREILGINSRNKTEKAAAERTAVNTVIQGTAAEIMKKAMIRIASLMEEKGVKSKLLLQVHDELIFEVPLDEVEMMKTLIQDTMEHVVTLPVPLRVSVEEGKSWGDMH
ncbi:MAG: DNA polymerase I, partial [Spirochaetales bacterium]|nr:DNA polymerase I [Candidatus Physcosoma equi]